MTLSNQQWGMLEYIAARRGDASLSVYYSPTRIKCMERFGLVQRDGSSWSMTDLGKHLLCAYRQGFRAGWKEASG